MPSFAMKPILTILMSLAAFGCGADGAAGDQETLEGA